MELQFGYPGSECFQNEIHSFYMHSKWTHEGEGEIHWNSGVQTPDYTLIILQYKPLPLSDHSFTLGSDCGSHSVVQKIGKQRKQQKKKR